MSEEAAGSSPPGLAAGLRVRVATVDDAEAIAFVHRESWRSTYSGILPLEVIAQATAAKSALLWRRRLALDSPEAIAFVAERERKLIGFASCGEARHRLEGLESEIYALYVLLDEQRHGAGRALVGECARHFVRHGRFGFYLWVLKANRARLFYEALGGQEIAEKTERLGLHSFAQVAYGWHELTGLVGV